jgi:hypothetical protein
MEDRPNGCRVTFCASRGCWRLDPATTTSKAEADAGFRTAGFVVVAALLRRWVAGCPSKSAEHVCSRESSQELRSSRCCWAGLRCCPSRWAAHLRVGENLCYMSQFAGSVLQRHSELLYFGHGMPPNTLIATRFLKEVARKRPHRRSPRATRLISSGRMPVNARSWCNGKAAAARIGCTAFG